jgi:type IV secretory pathway TraG/TraD family ATPase VirD4
MFGTTIYGRVAGGETAKWISERIGDRDVERPNETWSNQNGQPTCSISYVSEKIRLVIPSQLQSELGEGDRQVIMILDAFRKGVYQVSYPWVELTKFRKAHIPAAWLELRGQPASVHATNSENEAAAVAATSSVDKQDQIRRKFRRRDGPGIELQPEGLE